MVHSSWFMAEHRKTSNNCNHLWTLHDVTSCPTFLYCRLFPGADGHFMADLPEVLKQRYLFCGQPQFEMVPGGFWYDRYSIKRGNIYICAWQSWRTDRRPVRIFSVCVRECSRVYYHRYGSVTTLLPAQADIYLQLYRRRLRYMEL